VEFMILWKSSYVNWHFFMQPYRGNYDFLLVLFIGLSCICLLLVASVVWHQKAFRNKFRLYHGLGFWRRNKSMKDQTTSSIDFKVWTTQFGVYFSLFNDSLNFRVWVDPKISCFVSLVDSFSFQIYTNLDQ
jgi:hypothetical protein